MAVFSMKRATISTPAAAEYMHLSENHDVSRMLQLQVSHVWTHLQLRKCLDTPAVEKPPYRCLQGTFVAAGVPRDVTPGNDNTV